MQVKETTVVVVGGGPAGLAASVCLTMENVPNIVLERDDIYAPLWKKKSYDRLRLHLAKQFCELPYMAYPPETPRYVPKDKFIDYLDSYVSKFGINPVCNRRVVSAEYDGEAGRWIVVAENTAAGEEKTSAVEKYVAEFLVVATGENSVGRIPAIPGLEMFAGETLHTADYRNGKRFQDKSVLVVGCGNSGMEIALDLSNWGAQTSIVIRSHVHVLRDEHVKVGMELLEKGVEVETVDEVVVMLGDAIYGDLSEYGITRPSEGPFRMKQSKGRSAVIDVGTVGKIKARQIKVFPAVEEIAGEDVHFADGRTGRFDAIVFATGYNSTVMKWLKDDGGLFGENGMPKMRSPNHWKGEKKIYCTGFASAGLKGIAIDALNIAHHITTSITNQPT
ncbi:probable indole-3-pyruvate monooxygenase YUCCA10 [Andrographis paniculata]|uniref:probable indole-3-pyruvate monooxygenase YUCCA10 n=1 Tax=Andrographis paniculata TaxID=175694 RepID=UPI0021E80FB7|nr:probable indole-3-pyruvate monooxygenase YUCCA10 [Andrographis paniculata]